MSLACSIENNFGHDGASRVAGAKKQDVERLLIVGFHCDFLFASWRVAPARNRKSSPLLGPELAELGMPVAAIGHEERHQGAHAFEVGAIDDRATVTGATDKPRARQDGKMRRERVRGDNRRLRRWPPQASRRARAASASGRLRAVWAGPMPRARRARVVPTSPHRSPPGHMADNSKGRGFRHSAFILSISRIAGLARLPDALLIYISRISEVSKKTSADAARNLPYKTRSAAT